MNVFYLVQCNYLIVILFSENLLLLENKKSGAKYFNLMNPAVLKKS